MDNAWAEQRLKEYLDLCAEVSARQRANGHEWDDVCIELNHRAELELSTVEKIVHLLYPLAPVRLMPPSYSSDDSVQYVRRALGAFRDHSEINERLQPSAPVLPADRLHPTIWETAAPIWATGEYGAALQQASILLSARIRSKAQSHLRDRPLVTQVFSPDPPRSDTPRLHLPGDTVDLAWQARQQGLHLLAQGAFAGIRNVAAHEEDPWSEQEALELLAVLSTVARWADATERRSI